MILVDSHLHLWTYQLAEYGWIACDMEVLRRDYDVDDFDAEARASGIHAAIVVQARQSLAENDALLDAAARSQVIAGVVGWVDLRADDVERVLEQYASRDAFRGVRHIVQAEPDGFMDDEAFNRGVSRLKAFGLVYDILITARQLPEAIRFVDRHPNQPFVLDHLAKPTITSASFDETWAHHLRALAKRPHVTCKLSGLVTEVRDTAWSTALLQPYADVAAASFGASRLMMGSDWPVCRLRVEYAPWQATLRALMGSLSMDEQAAILGGTAARVYGLAGLAR